MNLQGVLSPKDARSAVDAGVDGLVLSNHGGRQLDHSPAPLDMIASVRRAIGYRVPLLMDGGIRRGTDVLKVGRTDCSRESYALWLALCWRSLISELQDQQAIHTLHAAC